MLSLSKAAFSNLTSRHTIELCVHSNWLRSFQFGSFIFNAMDVRLCVGLFNGFSILVIRAEDLNISRLLTISSGQFKLIHTSPLYLRERAEQIQVSETAIATFRWRGKKKRRLAGGGGRLKDGKHSKYCKIGALSRLVEKYWNLNCRFLCRIKVTRKIISRIYFHIFRLKELCK